MRPSVPYTPTHDRRRKTVNDTNFKAAVQLILQASTDGKPRHEVVLSLGATPQLLLDNGFPDLPMSIKGATIDKAHFDHGITRGVLERLGEIIATPKALYKSATVQGTAVVITFEMKSGSPILVPIHGNKPVGRSFTNLVASVYAKEATVEARWKSAGLLLWEKPRDRK